MNISSKFKDTVDKITDIGYKWYEKVLLDNSEFNVPYIKKTILELPKLNSIKSNSAIIVSAGPSLHNLDTINRIKDAKYKGTLIVVDGSYIRLLKHNIIPDYVITLDPHPTRIVRWFGDPDFTSNMQNDDYFDRQDLDVEFRNNSSVENKNNINLVNQYSSKTKLIICSSSPKNVVKRSIEAGFEMYWWAPLVDNRSQDGSLTRKINKITGLPCMNTGGTVGTAAWVFCKTMLGIENIAVVGMDLGYFSSTPYSQTQTYYELQEYVKANKIQNLEEMFTIFNYPTTNVSFYTDPTYYWYRQNLLDLVNSSKSKLYNCTESGTLYGPGIECLDLEEFIKTFDRIQ